MTRLELHELEEPLEVMPLWGDWLDHPRCYEVRAIVHVLGGAPEAVAFDRFDELVVERRFRRLLAREALAVLGDRRHLPWTEPAPG